MEPFTSVREPQHLTVVPDSSSEVSDVSSRTTAATTPTYTPEVLGSQLAKYNLTEDTLFQIQDVFIELVEAAGIMMVNAEHDVLAQAATKNNTSDLVSEYDKAIENMVQKRLGKEFPDFDFLGEESYKHGQKLTDGPTFIVDPVDGTINFTRGFHNFAISLCLAIDKKPVVGVVYSPKLGKLFTAVKTHGAFLVEELFVTRKKVTDLLELKNKNPAVEEAFGKLAIEVDGKTAMPHPAVEKPDPIAPGAKIEPDGFVPTFKAKLPTLPKYKLPLAPIPPPMPSLQKRLIAIEWGNERKGPNWDLRIDVHSKLLTSDEAGGKMILSCRSSGSAALDFCYVAAGMFDAFWEGGVWVWDVAAGWLVVEEAGGIIASANPGNWRPTMEGRTYFPVRGAKREEQQAVVKELWEVMGDRKFVYKDKKKPYDGAVSAAETA
ncbi:inositol monophosphatase [Stagonosporopsis vannaccii]|nr:inositol monophosphatase [Stagonosporopsis vannaccii]